MMYPLAVHRHVTSWCSDALIRGGWSYTGRHGEPSLRQTLAEPIGQRIVLAGEATCTQGWPGHMAGAHHSGRRAADQLAEGIGSGSVLVIGAGCAGLSAARQLRTHGFDVEVIDAASVIGGRARSRPLGSVVIDEGANWLHRAAVNPLTQYARDVGLTLHPTPMEDPAYVSRSGISAAAASYTHHFHDELLTAHASCTAQSASEWIRRHVENDSSRRQVAYGVLTMDTGAELHDIAMGYAIDEIGVGLDGGDLSVVGGMTALLESMLGDFRLTLRTRAQAIDWSQDDGVVVVTDAGALRADAVIVTVSLGVLKAGDVVFEPPLPPRYGQAIDRLGFGAAEKGVLLYSQRWWGELPASDTRWYDGEDTLWGEFFDFTDIFGTPAILALAAGDGARNVADMSFRVACDSLEETFQSMVRSVS